jgi:hypothetical protein
MQVRDVLHATSKIAGMDVGALLTAQTQGVRSLRNLGMLVSSRVSPASWTVIGQVWGGRSRASAQASALKAEVRVDRRDPAMAAYLTPLLRELGLPLLPHTRPPAAGYRFSRSTIVSRIAEHEARIVALRAQLERLEEAA